MINWKNFDSLASYKEIADVERVNLAEAMTGANGAERVKNTVFLWQQAWLIIMLPSR